VDLSDDDIGKEVALIFDSADLAKPIVAGVLRDTSIRERDETVQARVEVDGQRLTVCAEERLVLRCGAASITLTKEGKVLIAGTFVSSRSSGVNRIRGGSVEIN
jgi:hypothetical protein